MTFAINPLVDSETINLCSIWPPKDGKTPNWSISMLDVRLIKGDGGITVYGKIINHTGDVLHKKDRNKETKWAQASDFQGRVSFSIADESSVLLHKAARNLLSALDFSTPKCITLALASGDPITKAYAEKLYESPIPGQDSIALNDESMMAIAKKAGAIVISDYTGESLFKDEELVSRKGDTGTFSKTKSPKEQMDDRIDCLTELGNRLHPGMAIMDLIADDLFYRYASLVIK
jgi:hypothetical protein